MSISHHNALYQGQSEKYMRGGNIFFDGILNRFR